MEDAHAFIYDFGSVRGQGFFSVFDGHAGKHAAEWCGKHFHEHLLESLVNNPKEPVPDLFNKTYHSVDEQLSKLAESEGSSSGCTAVTVFLRLEDENGKPMAHAETGGIDRKAAGKLSAGGAAGQDASDSSPASPTTASPASPKSASGGGILSSFARRMRQGSAGGNRQDSGASDQIASGSSSDSSPATGTDGTETTGKEKSGEENKAAEVDGASGSSSASTSTPASAEVSADGLVEVKGKEVRRVLYTANVGDARAVLCRGGKAVRLTYDHKGSDAQEAKRITDAGGFVMNNRVNGVLAVTRSLGDSAMKEFVVGSPYTTETSLSDEDAFLIVACDGLWDVTDDQDAVDLVADIEDPQEASEKLLQHALSNFSTDNTSVMVVRFACSAGISSKPQKEQTSDAHVQDGKASEDGGASVA